MVNIDTVYQRVLILANKEQRGYITPQEYNLYANQAQVEIFEQYFYDLNQAHREVGNDTTYADVDDMLEEKMQIFETQDNSTAIGDYEASSDGLLLPNKIYRISRVEGGNNVDCDILSTKDFRDAINGGPLTRPTATRPIANIKDNIIRVFGNGFISPSNIFYFRIPRKVSWGYFVLREKALYNSDPARTTHFELHASEETELVYKILKFAGLGMKRDDVAKGGQGLESMQVQQEKQ
jgi:hypothetical protein